HRGNIEGIGHTRLHKTLPLKASYRVVLDNATRLRSSQTGERLSENLTRLDQYQLPPTNIIRAKMLAHCSAGRMIGLQTIFGIPVGMFLQQDIKQRIGAVATELQRDKASPARHE